MSAESYLIIVLSQNVFKTTQMECLTGVYNSLQLVVAYKGVNVNTVFGENVYLGAFKGRDLWLPRNG